MAGFFDGTENTTSPVGKSFFDDTEIETVATPERTLGSNLKDTGISLVKGVVGAGQGIIGLADIPTGGRVGKGLEAIGINPEEWQKDLSSVLSPAQQAANLKVDSAKGFVNTAQAMFENPSTIAHGIVETLPSVAAGGVLGKGALALGSRLAPKAIATLGKTGSAIAAGAVGEGAIGAGQTEEQIRAQTPDKLTTATQSGLAALSGLGTGIFGVVGGSLAKRLNFADVDTMIINGLNPSKKEGLKGVAKSIIGGGITEGVFEELPQTIQETIFTNAALDKPLLEGIPEGAAKAIILGGAMGGGANLLPGAKVGPVKTEEELAIENRAANILALDKEQFAAGTKKLNEDLQANKDLLGNFAKLEERARAENVDPKELISRIVYENKTNQALLDKVNAEVKVREEVSKKKAAEEYAKLSPEEKVIKDVENKLVAQRESEAIKINERLDAIDRIETIFSKTYTKESDPEKKKQMADRVFSLRKEKNTLLNKQKELVEKKSFAPYTTREERQKNLEADFGTANPTSFSDKNAAESAKVFEEELSSKNIADYVNHINNVKETDRKQYLDQLMRKVEQENNVEKITEYTNYIKNNIGAIRWNEYEESKQKQDLKKPSIQQMVDAIVKESDPVVRQKLYNQMLLQPGVKDAQESAMVFEGKAGELAQQEEARKQAEGEKFYTQLFAEEKRPFNIDAFNEVTTKSAEESAKALNKAGMFKGQTSSFTDERQVPLTDNQQIIVDKNNVEIAKLTEIKDRTIDRDQRINLLNKIVALEKDNALIRTSVEQFDALEEPANTWYSVLEQAVTGFQQKQATSDQWKGMIKNVPGIKQEELDWIGLNEWLDGQNGKVSKDALMNFIQANNVQLEEVVRGDKTYLYNSVADWDNAIDNAQTNAEQHKLEVLYAEWTSRNLIERTDTKYSSYQLPGGNNYKEILLTIPIVKDGHFIDTYQSGHWDEPNILAHIRFNERTDSEGNRILFLEEVQSDWHQEGRKNSYGLTKEEQNELNLLSKRKEDVIAQMRKVARDDINGFDQETFDNLSEEKSSIISAITKLRLKRDSSVPDAPFKKSWPLLAMKRMIRYAAENGFDKIAWTTGEQQADRYDLAKQVDSINVLRKDNDNFAIAIVKDGAEDSYKDVAANQLEDYVGKDLANKIINDLPNGNDSKNYSGLDLKVGGEGMKGFYDKILPAILNNEFNKGKWGNAKVDQIDIGLQKNGKVTKEEAIKAFYNGKFVFLGNEFAQSQSEIMQYQGDDLTTVMPDEVLSLPITERMKAKALGEGMPMFELSNGESYNPSASIKQETNLGNILTAVKDTEGLTGQLANFIADFIPESKLNIKVVIDPTAKSASYTGGNVNTITLRDPSQLTSSIHEITHAVTVREMIANPAIREQVKLLIARVKNKAIKEAILTPEQVRLLETERTSLGYKENITGNVKFENVAYGLLNEYEFLAQAMGNNQFQELLKATTIADKGVLRNAWDAFVELVMKALGIKDTSKNAFGEALSIIAKLASQENVNQTEQTVNQELIVEQRLPQSEYDAVYAEKNNRLSEFVQNAGIKYHEVKLLADKAFGSISTRLKKVDPELSEHLRWLDFKTSQKIIDILRTAKPLLEATKVMSPEDKSEWNWARLNSDTGKIERIESKYGLADQVKLLREKIDQVRADAIEVGYDVGFIEDYWPRVIKDTEGFLQATQGISQRAEFTEAIRDKAKELGITQTQFEREYPELKADIISNMILGRYYGIGGPGNIKARVFETIPKEYAKFYMDADASLMQYVYSMTKKIEARRFFGKVPERISNLKTSRNKKQADLIKFTQLAEMARTDNPEAFADYSERITGLNEDLVRIEESLNTYKHTNDYTENIGAYIDEMRITGRIQPKDEKTVKDILMARFNEQGTHGVVNTFKNASYIDVMANFSSAITQIGDLAWAMYVGKMWTPSGLLGTARNLSKAIVSKSDITKEDLGFERIAQEFADGTTLGRAVSKAFKIVGLEKIDTIGKEVLINNALDQYKAEAKRNPEALAAKIKPTFGNKSIDVVQEILADVPSDNVKMLLYSKVLDFQPAALSEMPEYYLTAGNGRVFYMLKTYTLKQMDVFRREVVHNIKSEDPKQKIQGLVNAAQLLVLLTLANAGADELKDWMLGKETRFSDNVIDNFLVMGGASRYTQMQISKEGFGSAMLQQVLPPMKFINSASKDLHEGYKNYVSGDTSSFDHARIIDSIPLAGKLYYWHYGRGEENKKSLAEKDFSEATKAADLFKKQLENSTDKRTFIEANLDRFKQMKLQENFQAALNRNKAVINKLEKLPSTENVQTRLGQLKNQREQILKKYIEVAKTM